MSAPALPRLRRIEAFGVAGYPVGAGRYLLEVDQAPHTHDFLELAVLVGGSATHITAEGSTALGVGSVVAVRPGRWHGYRDCRRADVFNLYLGPELLRRELLWVLDHPDLARFLLQGGVSTAPVDPTRLGPLTSWLTGLADQQHRPATPASAVALGRACCALGEIATASFGAGSSRRVISPSVRTTLTIMSDHPETDWTMRALAEHAGVSVPHLHRRFTDEVGTSPFVWLARTRVELAASLLIQSDRPVAEIAHLVGWGDPNYFSRRFRAISGDSPMAYRRRFR